MTKQEIINSYGSLSLAYIGDAAYELKVREYILALGVTSNGNMHIKTGRFVSALAQSGFLEKLMPILTEDEKGVVRRGRNCKPHSHPKNADRAAYASATAFEALWGYLYLAGESARLDEFFNIIIAEGTN